ncbi:MAG: hypothetical protein HETSPECPRED_009747 [Heterodermia speciosa]|uniref:Uncharacterized protein n=1 Tax=Heterodermia speciosa TaxID=116794 RepID=A0A8H3G2E2_9LECA|nr:MAG: hypothetical protein HETSPECPRED_009747 [Heterodermia speciosa]
MAAATTSATTTTNTAAAPAAPTATRTAKFVVEFSKAWRGPPISSASPPYVRPNFAIIYTRDSAAEAMQVAKRFLNERTEEEVEGWVEVPLRDEERTGGGEWAGDMRRWRTQEWSERMTQAEGTGPEGTEAGASVVGSGGDPQRVVDMKEWSADEWWDSRGCWVRRVIFGDGRMEIAVRVRGVIEGQERGRGEREDRAEGPRAE